MSILGGLLERRGGSPENPSTNLSNPDTWLYQAFGAFGDGSDVAGIVVNERRALQSSAVYAAVRVLAETVASLPLHVYERTPGGKSRAVDHPIYNLLHNTPNPEITPFTFFETTQAHVTLWGNAYMEIQRTRSGRPVALWPLLPDRTRPDYSTATKRYLTQLWGGNGLGETIILPAEDVLHVPGLGFDGRIGYSPIALQRRNIGASLATDDFTARYFGNGSRPGGVLEHPNKLDKAGRENLRESWERSQGGLANSHRVAILEEGMKWNQTSIPNDDAQFLETRKFQVSEIARMFRVPPHLIGDLERSTNNNIEQQSLEFVIYSLRPWLVRWEQALSRSLLTAADRPTFFVEFLVDGLLRGDLQTRYAAYAVGRQWGWLSADDVRGIENMNPLPNGDGAEYLKPLNMIPAGAVPAPVGAPPATADPAATAAPPAARGVLIAAHEELLVDAVHRAQRRETQVVRAAVKKGQSPADAYDGHRDYLLRTLQPPLAAFARAYAGLAGATLPPEIIRGFAEAAADRMMTASRGAWTDDPEARCVELEAAAEPGVAQDLLDRLAALVEGAVRAAA